MFWILPKTRRWNIQKMEGTVEQTNCQSHELLLHGGPMENSNDRPAPSDVQTHTTLLSTLIL